MDKLKKLVLLKQRRDRIDFLGDAVSDALTLRGPPTFPLNIPSFSISSAAAATVESVCQSWSGNVPNRLVVITAASAPLPDPGIRPLPLLSASCGGRSLAVEVIILPSPDTTPLPPQLVESWAEAMMLREVALTQHLAAEHHEAGEHVVIPLYFLRLPMQDNGSQRLADVMKGVTSLFDSCCDASSLGGAFTANATALRGLFHHNPSTVCAAPEVAEAACGPHRHHVGILVHCLQGISRSVAVVVWYLVEKFSILEHPPTVDEVLQWVRRVRHCACPNLCFAAELGCMERRLHK